MIFLVFVAHKVGTEDPETALKELILFGWIHAMQVFSLQDLVTSGIHLIGKYFFNLFLIQKTSPQSRGNKTMLLLNGLKPECDSGQSDEILQKQKETSPFYIAKLWYNPLHNVLRIITSPQVRELDSAICHGYFTLNSLDSCSGHLR